MNHYNFEEIDIGMTMSFEVTITEKQMTLFGDLTGDFNPLHAEQEYAIAREYQSKVVYGMLVSSFYSTLVGMYLPGEKCLLNKCEVNYRNPVYVGDRLTIYGEVVDKRESTQRIKIKGKAINQEGEAVNSAEIVVGFTCD